MIGRGVAYRKTGLHGILFISTIDLLQPPLSTVHPALHTTGSCSSTPPRPPLHRLLFIQPSTTRGHVHPEATPTLTVHPGKEAAVYDRLQLAVVAKESQSGSVNSKGSIDRSGSVMCSLQCNRSGSVRAQCLARVQFEPNASHPRVCVYERNAHRSAPTTHRNREHPDIFRALASTTVFFRHGRPKECHAAASPARPG